MPAEPHAVAAEQLDLFADLESGGPIRTSRQGHDPNHTGFGDYERCGAIAQERAS
jgi:hypothetical protein